MSSQFPDVEGLAFVDYDRRFLLASRRWLRDPELASLTMTPPFSDEDQERWFLSLASKTDYAAWGVEYQREPIGVFGLKRITTRDAEYFGFLGERQFWGRGFGMQMLLGALERARERGCSEIYLRVSRSNVRAIRLYSSRAFPSRIKLTTSSGCVERYEGLGLNGFALACGLEVC